MSESNHEDEPNTVQTDSESQELGALHGQNAVGGETGTSGDASESNDKAEKEVERSGEGTGAAAGEYS